MNKIENELIKLKNIGQFRSIPNIHSKAGNRILINGTEYLNLASNDYLGISTDAGLRTEFIKQNDSLLSSASARLLTGTSFEYKELEQNLANIFQKESALIFNTGYQANLGIISALVSRGDVIFSDKLNHASIVDGMRLSSGTFFRYKHLDYDNLEALLIKNRSQYNNAIIVSESIFSMDGDLADINRLIELKNKYNCFLMLDEAHAFCAYGNTFSGVSGELSFNKHNDIDIIVGTFGKALGSFGAFCVSKKYIIDYLINNARSFIFSTSIPPINIAWTNWLLEEKRDYIKSQIDKLKVLSESVHNIMNDNNIVTPSKSHIIPFLIGDNNKTIEISEILLSEGYYIPAIRPPTVPEGTSRLRVSLTAGIELESIKNLIQIIQKNI